MFSVAPGPRVSASLRPGWRNNMSARLARRFETLANAGRPGMTPFAVAGDPDPLTAGLVFEAMRFRGADIIEIGIPARAPAMDGPVIQRGHARATAAGAGSLDAVTQATRIRSSDPDIPLILMGYAAELRSAGPAPYMDAMANAGADGLLIVDAEPDERIAWSRLARERDLAFIQIVASDADAESPPGPAWARTGFVYCVASTGPTGGAPPAVAALAARAGKVRRTTGLPVMAGFGVRTPAMATAIGGFADAVAIGTVVVDTLEKSLSAGLKGQAAADAVGDVVADLSEGLSKARLTVR